MRIGLMGLAFGSTNKGCEALGYGFLNVLQEIAKNRNVEFDIDIFQKFDVDMIYQHGNYDRLKCRSVALPGIGSIQHLKTHIGIYKKDDIIFDFTAGDSFSDIYGMERFVRRTVIKTLAIKSKTPLVLGSQTYGPFKSFFAKKFAGYVINRSEKVFARDNLSCERVEQVSKQTAIQTVDVAFAMQSQQTRYDSEKLTVGINPSGLLWNEAYNQKNQFSLSVDYQKYCREVIKWLLNAGKYDVVLVPHVISDDLSEIDNDSVACKALKKEFPQLIEASFFETPVDAKSFISGLDMFTGARMHATIAAFTTAVPVLPFSYSPKFEGLFGSMGYEHIISGRNDSTETAVMKTIDFFEKYNEIKNEMFIYTPVIEEGVKDLIDETDKIIFS